MKYYKGTVCLGYGYDFEPEEFWFEMPDDATDEQVGQRCKEIADTYCVNTTFEQIEKPWKKLKDRMSTLGNNPGSSYFSHDRPL